MPVNVHGVVEGGGVLENGADGFVAAKIVGVPLGI